MKKIAIGLLSICAVCAFGGISIKSTQEVKAYAMDTCASLQTSSSTENVRDCDDLKLHAKSSYVMDFSSNTKIYAKDELQRLPIASMCKIMTLLLSFEAIDNGVMSLDEEITVSENAAAMGGSQVFLEANAKYPVRELIKSIVVCSANDSCVALAEKIAGSESVFVDRMNEKAKEMGANDTLFANCTGLPKEPQYSCAKDVAYMLKNLLMHKEYYDFSKVWMDKFQHPKGRFTEITNTNKLVRFYDGCDGGKTGFTNEAGFCLAATAQRKGMRIISVVIGEENSAQRFEDVKTCFDYAFANYTQTSVIKGGETLEKQLKVDGGRKTCVSVAAERDSNVFHRRGVAPKVYTELCANKLKAPIKKGEKVGEMIVFENEIEVDRVPLIACESVKKATFFDRMQEIAREWNG